MNYLSGKKKTKPKSPKKTQKKKPKNEIINILIINEINHIFSKYILPSEISFSLIKIVYEQ